MQCSTFSEQEYSDQQLLEQIINYQKQLQLTESEKNYALTMIGANSVLIQTYAKRIKTIYQILTQYSELQTQYQENVLQLSNLLKNRNANDRLQISKLVYDIRWQVQSILSKTNALRQQTKYPCDIHNFAVNEISTYQQLYDDNIIGASELPYIYQSIGLDFDLCEDELKQFLKKQLPKFRQIDLFLAQPQNSVLTILHTAINSIQQAFSSNDQREQNMQQFINMFNFKKMLNTEQQLKKLYKTQLELNNLYNTTVMKVPIQIDHGNQAFECVSTTLKRAKIQRNVLTESKVKDIDLNVTHDTNTDIDELDDEEMRKQLKEQQENLKIIDLDVDDEPVEKLSQIITLSHSKSNIMSNFNQSQLISSNQAMNSIKEMWKLLETPQAEQDFLSECLKDDQINTSEVMSTEKYLSKLKNTFECTQMIISKKQQLLTQIEQFNDMTDDQQLFEQFKVIQSMFRNYCTQYQEFHTVTLHYSQVDYQLNNMFDIISQFNIQQLLKMIQYMISNGQICIHNNINIASLFLYHKNPKQLIYSLIFGQISYLSCFSNECTNVVNELISQLTELGIYHKTDKSTYQYINDTFQKSRTEYIRQIIQNKNKYICQVGILNNQLQIINLVDQRWQNYNDVSLKILKKFEIDENAKFSLNDESLNISDPSPLSNSGEMKNLCDNFLLSFNKSSDSVKVYQGDKVLINATPNDQKQVENVTLDNNNDPVQHKKRRCCR